MCGIDWFLDKNGGLSLRPISAILATPGFGHTGNYLLGGSEDFGLEQFYSCCMLAL